MREIDGESLASWLDELESVGVVDLMVVAAGIRRDRAAIDAILQEAWSNGQVVGQVKRLKIMKRQIVGRANFDLLRQRVLHAA